MTLNMALKVMTQKSDDTENDDPTDDTKIDDNNALFWPLQI